MTIDNFSSPPQLTNEYFYRMLSPEALRLAHSYLVQEDRILETFLVHAPSARQMNFVAVGAGEFSYLQHSLTYASRYVLIEPNMDIYFNESIRFLADQMKNVFLIKKRFHEVKQEEIPSGNSLFVFFFNVISYIENPIQSINRLLKKGDVLFLSSWAKTQKARVIRSQYFTYLNNFETHPVVDPTKTTGLCNLDMFPFEKLDYYSHHTRQQSDVVDVLIIYT